MSQESKPTNASHNNIDQGARIVDIKRYSKAESNGYATSDHSPRVLRQQCLKYVNC